MKIIFDKWYYMFLQEGFTQALNLIFSMPQISFTEALESDPVSKISQNLLKDVELTGESTATNGQDVKKIEAKNTIKRLKQEFEEHIKLLLQTVIDANAPEVAKKIYDQFSSNDSIALKYLREFYQNGETKWINGTNFYDGFFDAIKKEIPEDVHKKFIEEFISEVVKDFSEGKSHSFGMMGTLLAKRRLSSYSLDTTAPFSSIPESMCILKELAIKGVKEAQHSLSDAYSTNILNYNIDIPLNLTHRERIDGLKTLALMGHTESQERYGQALYNNCFRDELKLSLNLSEQERRSGIAELIKVEKKSSFCFYSLVKEAKIGDLPLYDVDRSQRDLMIQERAEKGDKIALNHIIAQLVDGNKPAEQRFSELKDLHKKWPRAVTLRLISIMNKNAIDSDGKDSLKLSTTERLEWLEDRAFSQDNEYAMATLAEIYADKSFADGSALNMPKKERLKKLRELAYKGCKTAYTILHTYYPHKGSLTEIRDLIINAKGYPSYDHEKYLIDEIVSDPESRRACKFLLSIRESLC